MYRLVLISHLLSLRSEARLTSYLIGRWGRPCGARTSDHVIAPAMDHATHGGPYTIGGIIHKVALRDKCSRGSSHMYQYWKNWSISGESDKQRAIHNTGRSRVYQTSKNTKHHLISPYEAVNMVISEHVWSGCCWLHTRYLACHFMVTTLADARYSKVN